MMTMTLPLRARLAHQRRWLTTILSEVDQVFDKQIRSHHGRPKELKRRQEHLRELKRLIDAGKDAEAIAAISRDAFRNTLLMGGRGFPRLDLHLAAYAAEVKELPAVRDVMQRRLNRRTAA